MLISFSRLRRSQAAVRPNEIEDAPSATPADTAQQPPPDAKDTTPDAPPASPKNNWLSLGLALLAVYIIWGSTYLGIREALTGFQPFLGAGLRFLIAGVILYGFSRARGIPNPT